MADVTWTFSSTGGSIVVHTGVSGRAARTGHRLTIEMAEWSGAATTRDGLPVSAQASIVVDSLRVRSGEGGLTPLTGAEKSVARGNALKSLQHDKFPEIRYQAESFEAAPDGFRAHGTLTIHGRGRPHDLDVRVADHGDARVLTAETTVNQKDFGIKPYSLMMGALKVADEVRVEIEIVVEK